MTAPRPAPYPADTRAKGWRFEVNTEQVKKSDTWLRARTGYVRAHLLLLWSESWEQTPCGSLPDDDELLALLLDMEPDVFAKHRAVLMRGWWKADDGRLYHDTVTERVLAMLEKRAKDAARAARNRAKDAGSDASSSGVTRDTSATSARPASEFGTKHQAPSTDEHPTGVVPAAPAARTKPKRSMAIKTPIPEDFGVSERVKAWAAEKGFEKLAEHHEAFVHKARAKGYTYADWDLAFMEAIREDWAKLRSNGRGGSAVPAGERATAPSVAAEQTQEYLRSRDMTPAEREASERARKLVMSSIKIINGGTH